MFEMAGDFAKFNAKRGESFEVVGGYLSPVSDVSLGKSFNINIK